MVGDNISKTQIENLIDEWIVGKNAERNRAILRRRLIDGVGYEALAEEFKLSPRRIYDILKSGQRIIFDKM